MSSLAGAAAALAGWKYQPKQAGVQAEDSELLETHHSESTALCKAEKRWEGYTSYCCISVSCWIVYYVNSQIGQTYSVSLYAMVVTEDLCINADFFFPL